MRNEEGKLSPFHEWGEEDFDWNALNAASLYLHDRCRQFARLGVWTKEKYGTLRVSTTCAYFIEYDFIHHIFYPGYVRYMFPRWFRTYVDWPVGKALRKLGIILFVQKYQTAVLKHFWKRAAKKWPHISEEILDEYHYYFDK
jgi:hypothetical protein